MGVEKRAAPAKREAGTSAERATAREAGKFLKSEKNSVLENDQNARLSSTFPPFPFLPFSLFLFSLCKGAGDAFLEF